MKETKNKFSKNFIKILISLILVVISIKYSLKDINFEELKSILKTTNFGIALLPIPIILLSHLFRAFRWKVMLNPIKEGINSLNLFSAVMIGYAANSALPIPRLGELLRPYVISKKENLSFSSVFATIVIERILDLIFLIFLFGVSFITLSKKIVNILPNDINPNNLIILVLLFVLILLTSFYPPFFLLIINKIIKPISLNVSIKLLNIFEKFKLGLIVIKKPSAYVRLIFDSFVIWFLYAVPLYITFFAFEFQNDLHLGIVDAFMLLIISGIGVTIAPTPGAIGVYHILVSTAMVQLYGIPKEVGLAYATVVHIINYLLQIIVGGIYFMRENINIGSISNLSSENAE